ncbi:MAG: AI-2E family transporter [Lachnospiraceae bacterium]|jgi:sporulation integral membrane protein YtvI|nr:AI-2E family transporter [Lachnospiraceae bacterium]
MEHSSLLHQFVRLLLVTAGVYLSFRYLLPLIFPFLLAYILIRMLYPIMIYLHKRLKLPRIVSHYGTLFGFFAAVTGILLTIFWKISTQLRLFFSNFPVYRQLLNAAFCKQTERFCHCIDYYLSLENGTVLAFMEEQISMFEQSGREMLTDKAGKTLVNCISGSFQFFAMLLILIISMLLLVKEIEPLHQTYRNSSFFAPIHSILVRLKESGLTYLKTEGIILLINWLACSLGLFLIHNPYFFLLGMGIAIFDAFPVLGSGFIFIPWALIDFFGRDYYSAAILITTYLITLFVREFLEAKLLGKGMGLNPFFMIAAIFIGIELFGVTGIFLGPLAIVLIQAILAL